jgi:hypothetical protein
LPHGSRGSNERAVTSTATSRSRVATLSGQIRPWERRGRVRVLDESARQDARVAGRMGPVAVMAVAVWQPQSQSCPHGTFGCGQLQSTGSDGIVAGTNIRGKRALLREVTSWPVRSHCVHCVSSPLRPVSLPSWRQAGTGLADPTSLVMIDRMSVCRVASVDDTSCILRYRTATMSMLAIHPRYHM